jgi:hypothetical protein
MSIGMGVQDFGKCAKLFRRSPRNLALRFPALQRHNLCWFAGDVHPIAVLESRIETESPHDQDESGGGAETRSGF